MSAITDLHTLLANLEPQLQPQEYVFAVYRGCYLIILSLIPLLRLVKKRV